MRGRKRIVTGLVILLVLGLSLTAVSEDVYEEWVARYNGPADSNDIAMDMAVDYDGNVYVTGRSHGGNTFSDFVTIRYMASGETLWTRSYNGPGNSRDEANALAIDSNGNVYVTGLSQDTGYKLDYATIKYSSAGNPLCIGRYEAPENWAEPNGIAVDRAGLVYVTGFSYGSWPLMDFTTIKYSPGCDTMWVRHYAGIERGIDVPNDLIVDDSGNLYVTGESRWDYATIKYSSSGDTLWVRRYSGPGGDNYALGIAVDDSGNVLTTGASEGLSTNFDYCTIKYSKDGNTVWENRYNGAGNGYDGARDVKADRNGNVYVTGWSRGSAGHFDCVTIKYAPNGDTIWTKSYNGEGDDTDLGNDIAIDLDGNVYVAVASRGNGSDFDYVIIKYDTNGNVLWTKRYNGPGNGYDVPYVIKIRNNGEVYITGESEGNLSLQDYATVKYSPCSANIPIAGDANSDALITLADLISTINYIFNKPGWPNCSSGTTICWLSGQLCRGDWGGDGVVTLSDVIHGINYIFNKPGGPWSPVPSLGCCPFQQSD